MPILNELLTRIQTHTNTRNDTRWKTTVFLYRNKYRTNKLEQAVETPINKQVYCNLWQSMMNTKQVY